MEITAGHRIAKWTGCDVDSLPKFYPVDLVFKRNGRVVGFCEVKTRKYAMDAFDTYMLSAHKVAQCRSLTTATGVPCFLAAQWSCGRVGMLRLDEAYIQKVTMGGRSDRGDSQDMEPVIHYPIDQFTMVP